ncbi:MAG: DUF433 domain-containing protein [bacterium]
MKTEVETQIISRSPDVMSGAPVFAGTRLPVQTIIDYLAGGHPLDESSTSSHEFVSAWERRRSRWRARCPRSQASIIVSGTANELTGHRTLHISNGSFGRNMEKS